MPIANSKPCEEREAVRPAYIAGDLRELGRRLAKAGHSVEGHYLIDLAEWFSHYLEKQMDLSTKVLKLVADFEASKAALKASQDAVAARDATIADLQAKLDAARSANTVNQAATDALVGEEPDA